MNGVGFLNSPFFITVVGGLSVSLVGHLLVRAHSRGERRLARERAIQDKQMSIITSFASDFDAYLSVRGSFLLRSAWLDANTSDDARDKYGRTRSQVYEDRRELWLLLMKTRSGLSMLAEINSVFEHDAVRALVVRLVAADDALDSGSSEVVTSQVQELGRLMGALVLAMGAEMRKPRG